MQFIPILFLSFLTFQVFAEELCLQSDDREWEVLQRTLEFSSWPLMENAQGQNNQWKGIGSLQSSHGNCTVNLIEPPGECLFNPDQEALVLTSGHCVDVSRKVTIGKDFEGSIKFNYFKDTTESQTEVAVSRVEYATMNKRDVAILRIKGTYRQLAEKGIYPRKVARQGSSGPLMNPAIPVLNVAPPHFIRQSQCETQARTSLIEGSFFWNQQIRLNCPAQGGSSGSGLYNSTGEIAGVLNTANNMIGKPHSPCQMNLPCEFQQGTASPPSGVSAYGFDSSFLHQCYSVQCEFDPGRSGCDMPGESPVQVSLISPTNNPVLKIIDQKFKTLRFKSGRAGEIDCASPNGFSEIALPNQEELRLPATSDGVYVVCYSGQDREGNWQTINNVGSSGFVVDRTPPQTIVKMPSRESIAGSAEPISDFATFQFKYADQASECEEPKGFRQANGVQMQMGISLRNKKSFVCIQALDKAGNTGQSVSRATLPIPTPTDAQPVVPSQPWHLNPFP